MKSPRKSQLELGSINGLLAPNQAPDDVLNRPTTATQHTGFREQVSPQGPGQHLEVRRDRNNLPGPEPRTIPSPLACDRQKWLAESG